MNRYRVDRAESPACPQGMNSLLYIGEDYTEAMRVYSAIEPGRDDYERPAPEWGVLLCELREGTYQPLKFKGGEQR